MPASLRLVAAAHVQGMRIPPWLPIPFLMPSRLNHPMHVQVGQCGNQIGCRFWELALREHAAYNTAGVFDDALSR